MTHSSETGVEKTSGKQPALYTRTGDSGYTSIASGDRLPKDHIIIEANGNIDEFSSLFGLVISMMEAEPNYLDPWREEIQRLIWIQNTLFTVASLIATHHLPQRNQLPALKAKHLDTLERWIDERQQEVPPLSNFILPSGSVLTSHIHLARAFCRRAERACTTIVLSQQADLDPLILPYMNRLSDYLFVLARWVGMQSGVPEKIWVGRQDPDANLSSHSTALE